MRQAGEPSVEDILASIKKVIARDSRGAGHEAARAPMSPAAAAAAIAPALNGGRARGPRSPDPRGYEPRMPERPVDITDVLDLSDMAAQIMGEHYAPAAPHHSAHSADDEDDGLLPQETTASMRDSLAALAMLAQPGGAPDRPLGRDLARRHGARDASPDAGRMARTQPAGHGRKDGRRRNRTHRGQARLTLQTAKQP
jgi:cell pole-organizing protein PopZ